MKIVSAATALLLLKGAAADECPAELANTEVLGDGAATLKYEVVHSITDGSIFCASMEADGDRWLGFGISPSGKMGGQGVIALPDDGTVEKYVLGQVERVKRMPDDKQTLIHTEVSAEGGKTTMRFAKLLEEEGENPIVEGAPNVFLWAIGRSANLAYHENRDDFTLDIPAKPVDVSGGGDIVDPLDGDGAEDVSAPIEQTGPPDDVATQPPREDTPTPPVSAPDTPPAPADPPAPEATPPAPAESTPSGGAVLVSKIGSVILGAGAAAAWFGM